MKTDISRRNFFATAGLAGLAAAGLGLAGCAPKTPGDEKAMAATGDAGTGAGGNVPAEWDEECDVLVLGGGGAGSTAALMAAREGASVIVLESQSNTSFSSTAVCKGNYCVIGSDEQKAAGIEDDVELFVQDALAYGVDDDALPGNKEEVIRLYAENSRECYDLLKELGVEFSAPYMMAGHSVFRVHRVDNADMQSRLTAAAQEAGSNFLFNTEFEELIVDATGTVLGAFASDGAKTIAVKAKRGVALTTGSFVRNSALVDDCLPGLSKVELSTGAGVTGKGHIAALNMGGQLYGRSKLYATEGMYPESGHGDCEIPQYGAIAVDMNGTRYIDEGSYWSNMRTRTLISKGTHPEFGCFMSWYVVDQLGYDAAREAGDNNATTGINEEEAKMVVSADTIEELAEKINAPYLPATLAKYNEDIAAGKDTQFGRTSNNGEGTGEPYALTTPPYYAWASKMMLEYAPTTTFMANGECQILNQYDEPIGGGRLLACGELIHRSIVGNHYLVGTSIGSCTTLGMVIGRKLAQMDAWE